MAAATTTSKSVYSRWGCVYADPPAHTDLRYQISRGQLGQKIRNREFHGLPVDMGHSDEIDPIGQVGDAIQSEKNGSVFVRIDLQPGSIAGNVAIDLIKSGHCKGLSLEHCPRTDDRKLRRVAITPVPGRPGTFLLPDQFQPPPESTPKEVMARFSAFEAQYILGNDSAPGDSLPPPSQNSSGSSDVTMSNTAAGAPPLATNATTPAPAATTTTNAAPATTNATPAKTDVLFEGQPTTTEELAALVQAMKKQQAELAQLRKQSEELTKVKQQYEEEKKTIEPLLQRQQQEAENTIKALVKVGFAAPTEAQKAQIDQVQATLLNLVKSDPSLAKQLSSVVSMAQQNPPPAPAQPMTQPQPQSQPREDRRTVKRFINELEQPNSSPASSFMGQPQSMSSAEAMSKRSFVVDPALMSDSAPQMPPDLRRFFGRDEMERQASVAYSHRSAEDNKLWEEFENNRVAARQELASGQVSNVEFQLAQNESELTMAVKNRFFPVTGSSIAQSSSNVY